MFSLDYRPDLASRACLGSECDTLIKEGYMPPTGPYSLFDVLRGALRKVMDPLEGVRVGLMLNHDHLQNCEGPGAAVGCSNGGYIAMGYELFDAKDSNGAKARFHSILDNIPLPLGGQSHSYQGKELYYELFRYLTGQEIYNGHNGWIDYFTDASANLDKDGVGALGGSYAWDAGIERGHNYLTPFDSGTACVNTYAVNMMFFVANQGDDSDDAIEDLVSNQGLGSRQRTFTDMIRYMNDADIANGTYGNAPSIDGTQNLTSYFIVPPAQINRTTLGYAQAGGTGVPLALSDDPDELVRTLQEVFNQILSVSTTFVAA
ncbi:MAG: hypothetical protein GWN29_11795, partial [Gammaproteobacteria bacterium]|nr:hypothetical protein [Gammaproteobacteria bacterium]